MIRKTLIALLAMIAALCFAVPAAAETFTSEDGVFSIELPNENWKQVEDPAKWIALSDGGSVITVEHYSNGEKLPDISVADNQYVNVYQAVFSTQNEVFIITGSVVDAAKIPEVANAIISAKVLKYDTKLAVGKEKEIKTKEFSIVPAEKTMYVTAEWLNVRRGCSVDEMAIGGFGYGASVKVLGAVYRNGEDIGWRQVEYEGGTGYVSGKFLSDTKPEPKKEEKKTEESSSKSSSEITYTGSVKTVYDEYGEAFTLYEGTDGYWRDRSGTEYVQLSDTEFQVRNGNKRLSTYYSYDDSFETGDGYHAPGDQPDYYYDDDDDNNYDFETGDGYHAPGDQPDYNYDYETGDGYHAPGDQPDYNYDYETGDGYHAPGDQPDYDDDFETGDGYHAPGDQPDYDYD